MWVDVVPRVCEAPLRRQVAKPVPVPASRLVFPERHFRVGKWLIEGVGDREIWELTEASPLVPGVPYRSGDLLFFFGVIRVGGVVYHCRCIDGVEVVVSVVVA